MICDGTIAPTIDFGGYLRALQANEFPFEKALMELVDNSFDAGATQIDVREVDGDLYVSDNGRGFDDIRRIVQFGMSDKDVGIGRYGVGMKTSAVRYSVTTVVSSSGRTICVPWNLLAKMGSLAFNKIVVEPSVPSMWQTEIVLRGFRTKYRSAIKTENIRRNYSPLLDSGELFFTVNGERLKPVDLPKFTENLDVSFDWRGKHVRLVGGTYDPSDPQRKAWSGYCPFYSGRMIGPGNIRKHGVGDDGCAHFCFHVHLKDGDKKWVLATHKDDIEDLPELLSYCYDAYTQPLLERAANSSQYISLKAVEKGVESLLNGGGSGNITRSAKENEGSAEATGSGPNKRNTNSADTEGAYAMRNSRRERVKFSFASLGNGTLGEIRESKALHVTFNMDNAYVAKIKDDIDTVAMCVGLCVSHYKAMKGQDMAPDEMSDRAMEIAGSVLADLVDRYVD